MMRMFDTGVLPSFLVVSLFFVVTSGCSNRCSDQVVSVNEIKKSKNELIKTLEVVTKDSVRLFVRYWMKGDKNHPDSSAVSISEKIHYPVLNFLKPASEYEYEIVTRSANCESVSEPYSLFTGELPDGLVDLFNVDKNDSNNLPRTFRSGYILLSRRDLPGISAIVNTKGKIIWYNQVNNRGFKVSHFTKHASILSILAPPSFPTSYGDEILELSLTGDTLFHLKKGEKGFDITIHHEIFWNDSHQLVTLTLEKRVFDLRKIGGSKKDTIAGDGILVLDKNGNKIWSWTVFDVLDPLTDPNILKEKSDWMHANSICIDSDGNYVVSFYLTGQIWKVNAKTGKLIWKMGRGGDFNFPEGDQYFESHNVHFVKNNEMVLFENGTNNQQSKAWAYTLDQKNRKADLKYKVVLPSNLYSARMGSAYLIDSSFLVCSSQARSVAFINEKGNVLWHLRLGFIPYRAEFIKSDALINAAKK